MISIADIMSKIENNQPFEHNGTTLGYDGVALNPTLKSRLSNPKVVPFSAHWVKRNKIKRCYYIVIPNLQKNVKS